jgi:pyrroline-5-carboxylate reductase
VSDPIRIGVIGGAGWLGSAIVDAILGARIAAPELLSRSYRSTPPTSIAGVFSTKDNQKLVDRSDVIVVSVRPADWPAIAISADRKLIISVMAGVPIAQLAERLGTTRVIRALPNAAAAVRKSYTPWVSSEGTTVHDRMIARRIFEACGSSDEVHGEAEIDYLTGLSGSGPAFPALLALSMMDDAVSRGIDPETARRAVNTLIVGAGRLLEMHDANPRETLDAFLNYGGTTAAAIEAMRSTGFEAAIRDGLEAALRKAVTLGLPLEPVTAAVPLPQSAAATRESDSSIDC